ncbi:hypothetical protein [Paenibacillus sp. S150]|uniref:hypothetical protein n=1 Tax=Paenibacillus sp. S150 TaxID=2749826 RepID=UPI001C595E60|nr:hypothetical protein [Paenibacillus sp. S150]MBW4081294.1 hypothetical protein [Paenibacillus sp. S150]
MAKSIQKVITRGVQQLGISPSILESLFRKAEELLSSSTFLTFEPKGGSVLIGDGNGKSLGALNIVLPQKVWIVFDDYGNRWVATLLLPEEY